MKTNNNGHVPAHLGRLGRGCRAYKKGCLAVCYRDYDNAARLLLEAFRQYPSLEDKNKVLRKLRGVRLKASGVVHCEGRYYTQAGEAITEEEALAAVKEYVRRRFNVKVR